VATGHMAHRILGMQASGKPTVSLAIVDSKRKPGQVAFGF